MPESPNPGQSYEAWIESKAGACPPPWECSPGAHEFVTTAECHGMLMRECRLCGLPEHKLDWPFPPQPPWPADDEDDEAPDE